MISVWLNDSLISLNGSHSFPNVELLVERLSVGVLPEIRKSLVSNYLTTDVSYKAQLHIITAYPFTVCILF